jgi:hypothetical protein
MLECGATTVPTTTRRGFWYSGAWWPAFPSAFDLAPSRSIYLLPCTMISRKTIGRIS